jgi:hypothetical protein
VLTRAAIIDAIRAGYTTAPKIAKRLHSDPLAVSNVLFKMRDLGRVIRVAPVKPDGVRNGRPPVRWIVNEDWKSRRHLPRSQREAA